MNRKRLLALVFVSGAIVGAAFGSSASRLSEVYGHALPADTFIRSGTKIEIQRQTGRLIEGTPTKQIRWHRLRVYRTADSPVQNPPVGNIWTMKVGGNPDVLLVEDQADGGE